MSASPLIPPGDDRGLGTVPEIYRGATSAVAEAGSGGRPRDQASA